MLKGDAIQFRIDLSKKIEYKKYAQKNNQTLSEFIISAIEEKIEKEKFMLAKKRLERK